MCLLESKCTSPIQSSAKQERNQARTKPNKNETETRTKRKQERNGNKNETKRERNQTTKQAVWVRGYWGGKLPQIGHLQHPNYFPTGNRPQPKTDFHHTFLRFDSHTECNESLLSPQNQQGNNSVTFFICFMLLSQNISVSD